MIRPRPEIEFLQPAVHGGEVETVDGRAPVGGDLLDFSVCTNPLGTPEFLLRDLRWDASRYPDSQTRRLRELLAAQTGLATDQIVFGSGSTELIRNVALAYFGRGDRILIAGPTFGEYTVACKISGAQPIEIIADASDRFRLGPDDLLHAALENKVKGIVLCNPNNPTGQYFGQDAVRWLLSRFPGGLLVLDEAYVTFADQPWSSQALLSEGNVIVVRSMTKDFALAGLRLGYALGSAPLIDPLVRVAAPWSVNVVAQEVGARCLELAPEYLHQVRDYAARGSEQLRRGLAGLGYEVVPSQAHYFLVQVGNAQRVHHRLLRDGVVVRDCTSFGLPAHVRIAPRRPDENEVLIDAFKRLALERAG